MYNQPAIPHMSLYCIWVQQMRYVVSAPRIAAGVSLRTTAREMHVCAKVRSSGERVGDGRREGGEGGGRVDLAVYSFRCCVTRNLCAYIIIIVIVCTCERCYGCEHGGSLFLRSRARLQSVFDTFITKQHAEMRKTTTSVSVLTT